MQKQLDSAQLDSRKSSNSFPGVFGSWLGFNPLPKVGGASRNTHSDPLAHSAHPSVQSTGLCVAPVLGGTAAQELLPLRGLLHDLPRNLVAPRRRAGEGQEAQLKHGQAWLP